jgi:MOSC domain-containing protein YiiM
MAKISRIFIAPLAGEAMLEKSAVKVLPGIGIEGDRYALGLGAYSKTLPEKSRDISLITRDGIDAANQVLQQLGLSQFSDFETRRNVIIEGLSAQELNSLVGKEFYLGNLKLRATELCIPCERPSKLTKKKGFLKAFEARGGIRAQILEAGHIQIGDPLKETLST